MRETKTLGAGSWLPTAYEWLADSLPQYSAPFSFHLIQAGGSNLTYIVSDVNGKRFVVRRPPLRARLATAHDMRREFKIMTSLSDSNVPVPAMTRSVRSYPRSGSVLLPFRDPGGQDVRQGAYRDVLAAFEVVK